MKNIKFLFRSISYYKWTTTTNFNYSCILKLINKIYARSRSWSKLFLNTTVTYWDFRRTILDVVCITTNQNQLTVPGTNSQLVYVVTAVQRSDSGRQRVVTSARSLWPITYTKTEDMERAETTNSSVSVNLSDQMFAILLLKANSLTVCQQSGTFRTNTSVIYQYDNMRPGSMQSMS